MKILLGIDDSPCSRAAVRFVRHLGLPVGTRVTVLSAVQPAVLMAYAEAYVLVGGTRDRNLEAETEAHQNLISQAEFELRDTGLVTEAQVQVGDPRDLIIQVAKDMGADLVVVGSHGRSGLRKLVMGSVAAHVMAHAPCSVLIVKSEGVNEDR